MISYAQNFEDVMLARALGDRGTGFYVDVGACYPLVASVTKHFYDAGWCGVNVEPMIEPFEKLAAARPRDVNLRIAVAGHTGELELYEGPTVGETSATRPYPTARPLKVPCVTLAELCERHANRPIDFLKIDVEGLERDVVAGGDWQRFRPTIVVVEVTRSWSTARRDDAAEIGSMLASDGYREVYFDGINAFFLAIEAEHLAVRFSAPPNVLDRFKSAHEAMLEEAVAALQRQSGQSTAALAAADARTRQADADMAAAVRAEHEANLLLRAAVEQSRQDAEAVRQAARRGDLLERELARVNDHAKDLERARVDSDLIAREAKQALEVERDRLRRLEQRLTETVQTARLQAADASARVEQAVARAELAEAQARAAEARIQSAETLATQWEARAAHAESAFRSIERSNSWRLTAPLRQLRALGRATPKASTKVVRNPYAPQLLARRTMRALVGGTISATKRLGIYEPVASWLRSRHPSAWARAKRAMLEGAPAHPAPHVAMLQGGSTGRSTVLFGDATSAMSATEPLHEELRELSIEMLKDRIRAEIQRQSRA